MWFFTILKHKISLSTRLFNVDHGVGLVVTTSVNQEVMGSITTLLENIFLPSLVKAFELILN